MNKKNKVDCYITLGWKDLQRDKHSSLLGQLVSYEENKVLWIESQGLYLQHRIFFLTY